MQHSYTRNVMGRSAMLTDASSIHAGNISRAESVDAWAGRTHEVLSMRAYTTAKRNHIDAQHKNSRELCPPGDIYPWELGSPNLRLQRAYCPSPMPEEIIE